MTKQASLPKVSIMMIAYNQERFIASAIESAIDQDYPNLEIIVSDDASSDRTPEIIRGYALRFPNLVIPVLNQVNRGITANSNAGLRACTGDLVAFVDGDDLFVPGKIAVQVKWFDGHPERALCGHLIEIFHDDESRPATLFPPELLSGRGGLRAVDHILFSKISMMVRAGRIPAHGFDESLTSVSDLLFPIEVLGEDGCFGFIEGVYARARRHDRNVTNQPFKLLGDYAHHFDLVEQRFPQYAATCRRARTRRLHYDVGVMLLGVGRKREARSKFLEAVQREPSFAKAWIRTAQSFL